MVQCHPFEYFIDFDGRVFGKPAERPAYAKNCFNREPSRNMEELAHGVQGHRAESQSAVAFNGVLASDTEYQGGSSA